MIRKRKRFYTKYKKTRANSDHGAYKKNRNHVNNEIRKSKQAVNDKLADKLKDNTLRPKDWWKTLKRVIKPSKSSNYHPFSTKVKSFVKIGIKLKFLTISFLHKLILMKQMQELQRKISKTGKTIPSKAYIYLPLKLKLVLSH